jgi:hypothetical protein
MVRE